MIANPPLAFTAETLLEEARSTTGLTDFGPDDFRVGLGKLVEIAERNPFTDHGVGVHRQRLVHLLSTRLRIEEAYRRHPEIRERPIRSPRILTGLPRSGTSALFNLLAVDPASRPLLMWETVYPDPNWELQPGEEDPRHLEMRELFDSAPIDDPEFAAVHEVGADTPEECVLLQGVAFDGGQLGYELMLEPYRSWFVDHDLRPLYRYYSDVLRLLDFQRPGERWLLKTPAHLWALDALVEEFPDRTIVWNHRDPAICVASITDMIHLVARDNVEIEPARLGPLVLDHYATSMERALADRAEIGDDRFVDVAYDDLVADPLAVVESIYAADGGLDPSLRAALAEHIAANPKGKHGTHSYDLETWSLTREQVRERFSAYIERFDL